MYIVQANPDDKWSDYIRGEWWIGESGAEFADIDVGEAGHEMIAVDSLLDADVLLEGLAAIAEEEGEEFDADQYMDSRASEIYFNERIPDELGAEAAGSMEIWKDIKKDARLAYAKHRGAILVVNLNFYLWQLTPASMRMIQDFIWEQLDDVSIKDSSTELVIEEVRYGVGVYGSASVSDFLEMKGPREFWRVATNNPVRRQRIQLKAPFDYSLYQEPGNLYSLVAKNGLVVISVRGKRRMKQAIDAIAASDSTDYWEHRRLALSVLRRSSA